MLEPLLILVNYYLMECCYKVYEKFEKILIASKNIY